MPSNVLPPAWTVVTAVEIVPGPVDIGQTAPRTNFARRSTTVRDSAGNWICASGSEGDARSQALALAQQRMQPYDSTTWPFA